MTGAALLLLGRCAPGALQGPGGCLWRSLPLLPAGRAGTDRHGLPGDSMECQLHKFLTNFMRVCVFVMIQVAKRIRGSDFVGFCEVRALLFNSEGSVKFRKAWSGSGPRTECVLRMLENKPRFGVPLRSRQPWLGCPAQGMFHRLQRQALYLLGIH